MRMGKPLVPAVDRRTDVGESQGWSSFIVNGVNAVEAIVNAPSEYSWTLKACCLCSHQRWSASENLEKHDQWHRCRNTKKDRWHLKTEPEKHNEPALMYCVGWACARENQSDYHAAKNQQPRDLDAHIIGTGGGDDGTHHRLLHECRL
ncbi:unnamed protein product [Vicia faba]|uniref:C2H2-type domain-containing protein n=1 Tax=Vicia faba TaxID=3906 RepID=A0AAV1A2Z3_VICFA|nr:unnamed protein product [Vicia faba]